MSAGIRSLLALACLALVAGAFVAVPSHGAVAATGTDGVELELVTSGLSKPTDIAAPEGDERLFVVERDGRIRIVENGRLLATPFLDIRSRVRSGGSEQGLLGLAFDPNYTKNGRFYVNYTAESGGGDSVISRFKVSSGDPNRADSGSEVRFLQVNQPYTNHNGGQVAVGPDGFLYASLGDGGSGGDPLGNGQNKNSLLGTIIRINRFSGEPAPGNPFIGTSGDDRIWVWGLRNPWRFSFDAFSGDMLIADVGQNAWEEIDVVPAGDNGLNFGWNEREGAHCYVANCETAGLVDPIHEYAHGSDPCSASITGGYVYRGNDLPWLRGHYFYADYCKGSLRSFFYEDGVDSDHQTWTSALGAPGGVTTFGLDGRGELYLAAGSSVYRLAPTSDPRCDVDGDGDSDVAVGIPYEDPGNVDDAGVLQVFAGTPNGVDVTNDRRFHQGKSSIVGLAKPGDRYAAAVACGDFDGDGYDDLAAGVPGDDRRAAADAGAVSVIPGSPAGPDVGADRLWHQDSQQIRNKAESDDRFGETLAAGDFNRDGYADLAIGVPGESFGALAEAGAVNVLYGSSSGLRAAGNQFWRQGKTGVLDGVEPGDRFGAAVAAGDFDGDGFDDLAVGVPGEKVNGHEAAGMVHVLFGSAAGLTTRDLVVHRNSKGIQGVAGPGDEFGAAVAAGHFDADGFDDLAVGIPGAANDAGRTSVLYGTAGGPGKRDDLWGQGKGGLLGVAEAGDRYGATLETGDFNRDGYDELVVAAPAETLAGKVRAGQVGVIPGSGGGLTAAGDTLWSQSKANVAGTVQTNDRFGAALRVLDADGDDRDDLVVGIPQYANPPAQSPRSGEVALFYGGSGGLTTAGNELWSQATGGVTGNPNPEDRFGGAL
jgi:glucose/arabinose dehydrogenase